MKREERNKCKDPGEASVAGAERMRAVRLGGEVGGAGRSQVILGRDGRVK